MKITSQNNNHVLLLWPKLVMNHQPEHDARVLLVICFWGFVLFCWGGVGCVCVGFSLLSLLLLSFSFCLVGFFSLLSE